MANRISMDGFPNNKRRWGWGRKEYRCNTFKVHAGSKGLTEDHEKARKWDGKKSSC